MRCGAHIVPLDYGLHDDVAAGGGGAARPPVPLVGRNSHRFDVVVHQSANADAFGAAVIIMIVAKSNYLKFRKYQK